MIANLVAMPAVSVWVMPAGILGVMGMPLGLDGFWWRVMGHGIDWMISVAQWVTSFPGALGRVTAFGTGPLLLCSAGLVVLCLLKTPLRFIGALLIGVAAVLMMRAPQPDVMVAADGSAVAIRGENGRLAMVKSGSDVFAWREWLAADADGATRKTPRWAKLSDATHRVASAACATVRSSPFRKRSKPSGRTAAAPCWW